ncbi:MAG: sugar transferase, partial [bacterium]|nr:sugar transferase [bacterium]
GVILFITSILVFYGTVYLLNYTNLGKKLAFLVTGAGTAAWMTIGSLLFVLYAPRGPRPVNIEGLNAFEVRIIPITFMVVSAVVFIGFLVGLHQYEEAREKADL